MTHPVVETVARATRRNRFERNGRLEVFDPSAPLTWSETADAQAAIIALFDAITEPTEGMVVQGDEAIIEALNEHPIDVKFAKGTPAKRCWVPMLQTCRADILGETGNG